MNYELFYAMLDRMAQEQTSFMGKKMLQNNTKQRVKSLCEYWGFRTTDLKAIVLADGSNAYKLLRSRK